MSGKTVKRNTVEDFGAATVWLMSNKSRVENSKMTVEDVQRAIKADCSGLELSKPTIQKLCKGLKIKLVTNSKTPLNILWDHVNDLKERVAYLETEVNKLK